MVKTIRQMIHFSYRSERQRGNFYLTRVKKGDGEHECKDEAENEEAGEVYVEYVVKERPGLRQIQHRVNR